MYWTERTVTRGNGGARGNGEEQRESQRRRVERESTEKSRERVNGEESTEEWEEDGKVYDAEESKDNVTKALENMFQQVGVSGSRRSRLRRPRPSVVYRSVI